MKSYNNYCYYPWSGPVYGGHPGHAPMPFPQFQQVMSPVGVHKKGRVGSAGILGNSKTGKVLVHNEPVRIEYTEPHANNMIRVVCKGLKYRVLLPADGRIMSMVKRWGVADVQLKKVEWADIGHDVQIWKEISYLKDKYVSCASG